MASILHPEGSVRTRFEARSSDLFRALRLGAQRCDLGDEGLYLAEELIKADPWVGERERVVLGLLVLALMVAERQGASCLPLGELLHAQVRALAEVAGVNVPARQLAKVVDGYLAGQFSGLISRPGQPPRPLVIDGEALYSARAYWLEGVVAAALAERLRLPPLRDPGAVARVVDDVMARPSGLTLSEEQRAAVALAAARRITVITGGPGTGKTAVTAAVVRALAQLCEGPILLAAPTGKAALRMSEVLTAQLAQIATPNAVEARLRARPLVAATVHRLLGLVDATQTAPRGPALPASAVIIDESSMVDLELMAHLLARLEPRTALILVGDAAQLPSVSAGQVMADLTALAVEAGPAQGRLELGSGLVARLQTSYRMNAADPRGRQILEAATAILAGRPEALVTGATRLAVRRRLATDLTLQGVEWLEATGRERDVAVGQAWQRMLTATEGRGRALPVLDATHALTADTLAWLDEVLATRTAWKVLAVTHATPTGVVALNAAMRARYVELTSVSANDRFVHGEPVMMVANDYQRGLFNGDIGLVLVTREAMGQVARAWFRIAGVWTACSLEALGDRLVPAWAMTVHKSQGSEMDGVMIVLPEHDVPLVTRELLYTAVTRARFAVALVSSKNMIGAAKRSAQRHSRLASRVLAMVRG